MKFPSRMSIVALCAVALLLAACNQPTAKAPPTGFITLSLKLEGATLSNASALQPLGIPNDPSTGNNALHSVRVTVTDKNNDTVSFRNEAGTWVATESGQGYLMLDETGSAEVSLPSHLEPYTFESVGRDSSDHAIAYHSTDQLTISEEPTVQITLTSVLGDAVMVPRLPTNIIAPGEILDLMLVVMANGNDEYPADYLQAPLGDYTVTYDLDHATDVTLLSESNRGIRLSIGDYCPDILVSGTVEGYRESGGAIQEASAPFTLLNAPECLAGTLEADTVNPEVTLSYDMDTRVATGTANDNYQVERVEIYDGPVLVATTDLDVVSTNPDVAEIEFVGTLYRADLLVDPVGGLEAFAYDAAGNEATSEETPAPDRIDVEEGDSVQIALDSVADGGTITLPPGTFTEPLTITNSVTIEGDPNGGTVITLFGGISESGLSSHSLSAQSTTASLPGTAGVEISGPDTEITIKNVTIQGPGPNCHSNNPLFGIRVTNGATLYLENSKVLDIRQAGDELSSTQCGVAILIGDSLEDSGTAFLTNVEIAGFQKNGITVKGVGSYLEMVGGEVIGEGLTGKNAQNGVQISYGATAKISGVTIRDVLYRKENSITMATAILLYEPGPNVALKGNTIEDSGRAVGIAGAVEDAGGITIEGNTFDNVEEYVLNWSTSEFDVSDNTFDGVTPAQASFEELLAIEDMLDHVLDAENDPAEYGLVRILPDHVFVTESSGSIQRGIDAAADFDVVVVGSGRYEVSDDAVDPSASQARLIQIRKPLTLVGPNAGVPGTDSRQAEAELVVSSDQAADFVTAIQVYADDVTIDGLKIQAYNPVEGSAATEGIWVSRSVTSDLEIRNMVIDGAEWSIMVNRGRNNGTAGGFVIENNMIRGPGTTSSQAIYVQAADAQVRNNYVTGAGAAIHIQPYGNSFTGLVEGNTFEAHLYGMWFNYQEHADAFWQFSNNQVTRLSNETSSEIEWNGIRIETFQGGRVEFTDNIIDAGADDPDNDEIYLLRQRNVTDGVVKDIGTLDDLGLIFTSNTFSGFDAVTVEDLTELDGLLQLLRPAP